MTSALLIVGSYLLGSISFAVVVSRLFGLPDPHSYGSGNPGATNVLRTGNRLAAILTLVGDGLKGWLAVFAASRFTATVPEPALVLAACGLAVFLGHLWPVFHRFSGGKGVATAAGILFAFSPWLGLSALGVWLVLALVFRISSVSSLGAAAAAPALAGFFFGNSPITWVLVPIAALLVWRHRANIEKLLSGRETRIGR